MAFPGIKKMKERRNRAVSLDIRAPFGVKEKSGEEKLFV
jgi:hypothetical protein